MNVTAAGPYRFEDISERVTAVLQADVDLSDILCSSVFLLKCVRLM